MSRPRRVRMMGIHPSFRGAVERLTLEGVEVTMRNGRATNPPMPSFEGRLSEEELDDVVAYLDTLPVGPRNFGAEDGGMMGMDGMMDGGMWRGSPGSRSSLSCSRESSSLLSSSPEPCGREVTVGRHRPETPHWRS